MAQPCRAWARACLPAVVALAGMGFVGCQTYNPNLGAPSALSSQLNFMTPSAKRVGDPAFTLAINGAGFTTDSVVQWNGSDRATNFVDASDLTASISAADIASAGVFQVRVMSPQIKGAEGNNFSNILSFQVCSGACPQTVGLTSNLVSSSASGSAYSPSISADGRYVAFASVAADPSANASAGLRKIYLRDTCGGAPAGCVAQTTLVSSAWQGGEPNAESRSPAISADGRYVAFASDASDIIENDANGVSDVFVRDTCTGGPPGCTPATTRVSVGPGGVEANGASHSPAISADGRFVAFDSAAQNLVSDSSSAPAGAFVYDTCRGVAAGQCTPSTKRLAISPPAAR